MPPPDHYLLNHRARSEIQQRKLFPIDSTLTTITPAECQRLSPRGPQLIHSLLRSAAARTIHREHRAERDAEHEAADVRPPCDSARHPRAAALCESRVELNREPEQQVDDRGNLDEL